MLEQGTDRRESRPGVLQAREGRRRRIRDPDDRSGTRSSTCRGRRRGCRRWKRREAINDVGERIRTLFNGNDRVGQFLRETLAPTLVYAAQTAPAVAYSADDVDRVMRWGFGWELGPFETADAIGIDRVLEVARQVSPALLERGVPELWKRASQVRRPSDLQILANAKDQSRIVKKNAGASLVDIGDGVLAIEFHSKMNAIGGDTLQMLQAGVREAERNFAALVVGNDAPHFSAGANLMLVLLEAQEENWDDIDLIIRQFQQSTMGLRYCERAGRRGASGPRARRRMRGLPACRSRAGGWRDLHGAGRGRRRSDSRRRRHQGDGGAGRGTDGRRAATTSCRRSSARSRLIGFGKTSASGPDAQRLGYLRPVDAITMNRDRLMADAKARALQRVRDGYQPPPPRTAIPVGGRRSLAALKLGVHLAWRAGRISDHDALIGRKLATIMAGGDVPHPTTVTEQQLLDLEREAFLSLVAERKTQERIQHTLKTGKPLRN